MNNAFGHEQAIAVNVDLRKERREAADGFREQMEQAGTYIVRLISSPGAGKTTLLQKTAQHLSAKYRLGILVGDIETDRDAQRLAPFAPSCQITTGGACHLELPLVQRALPKLAIDRPDFLFIEDVGNLICPASHELGEHLRVILLSTTEGDDKPGKYPKAFRTSQVCVISKTDLLQHVPFSVEAAIQDMRLIQPGMRTFQVSAIRDEGIVAWCDFLENLRVQLFRPPDEPNTSK
jgi:hydrogenase nickel incorporation protein HypB